MERVVLAGATGETGRRTFALLRAAGREVRVLARDPERARALLGAPVDAHRGDVRDAASLAGAIGPGDVVIATIGTRSYFGRNGGAAVDALGTGNLASAAARAGAARFVLLSAFGLDRRSPFLSAFSLLLNRYFVWKAAAEAAVRGSGVPWTIVRPVELRNRPPRGHPRLEQTAPLSLLRTVSRDLVAATLAVCASHPEAPGKTFELCESPEVRGTIEDQLAGLAPEPLRGRPPRTPLCGP